MSDGAVTDHESVAVLEVVLLETRTAKRCDLAARFAYVDGDEQERYVPPSRLHWVPETEPEVDHENVAVLELVGDGGF